MIKFKDLKIGDKFEVYGDTFINYDYPKICVCVKIEKDVAKEIDGILFFVNINDNVFEYSNIEQG